MKNKTIYIISLFLLCASCKVDCESIENRHKKIEYNIVVSELQKLADNNDCGVIGKDLKTGNEIVYKEENRWFCRFYSKINRGDTIVKKKNELNYSIHKKDTILNFVWLCEN
jgi:hypothetical protein